MTTHNVQMWAVIIGGEIWAVHRSRREATQTAKWHGGRVTRVTVSEVQDD